MWVADADEEVARHHREGERAFEMVECVGDGVFGILLRGAGDEVEDDFAVGRAPEYGALFLEISSQACGVDEVAIVAEGKNAAGVVDQEGLGVCNSRLAGG